MRFNLRSLLFANLRLLSFPQCVLLFLTAIGTFSCNLLDEDEMIPAYIRVDDVSLSTTYILEGSNSQAINDCWLYIDDQLIGIFEPPFSVPVLYEGQSKLEIFPGIKKNGISNSRVRYPFYTSYLNDSNLILEAGEEHLVKPKFNYISGLEFAWKEDFEDLSLTMTNAPSFDADLILKRSSEAFEGNGFGLVELGPNAGAFKALNSDALDLPQLGAEIYIELDYKCDSEFEIGYRTNRLDGSVFEQSMIVVNPTTEWKKIYVELGEEISEETNVKDFEIFILAFIPEGVTNSKLYFDNIKLLFRK